jgi:hypothetical protein
VPGRIEAKRDEDIPMDEEVLEREAYSRRNNPCRIHRRMLSTKRIKDAKNPGHWSAGHDACHYELGTNFGNRAVLFPPRNPVQARQDRGDPDGECDSDPGSSGHRTCLCVIGSLSNTTS